ncbi:microneme protein 13 [Cystoisospora suis]|uniref:Microneme protein 13 n=1 Tax=Cystoisospora suis TaxID=483139 RepID=A0A2C6LD42_9APIC|nr:microneme protein 13 [Cystoisospora suis]
MKGYKVRGALCIAASLLCASAEWQGVDALRVSHDAPRSASEETPAVPFGPEDTALNLELGKLCPALFEEKCRMNIGNGKYCNVPPEHIVVRYARDPSSVPIIAGFMWMCVLRSQIKDAPASSRNMKVMDNCGTSFYVKGELPRSSMFAVIPEGERLKVTLSAREKFCSPRQRKVADYCSREGLGTARYDYQRSSGRRALTCVDSGEMDFYRESYCLDFCGFLIPCPGARMVTPPKGELSFDDWNLTSLLLHEMKKVEYPCKAEGMKKCVPVDEEFKHVCEAADKENPLGKELVLSTELGPPPLIIDGFKEPHVEVKGTAIRRRAKGDTDEELPEPEGPILNPYLDDEQSGTAGDTPPADKEENPGQQPPPAEQEDSEKLPVETPDQSGDSPSGGADEPSENGNGSESGIEPQPLPSPDNGGSGQETGDSTPAPPEPVPEPVPVPTFGPEKPVDKPLGKEAELIEATENPTANGGISATVGDCQAFRVTPEGKVEFYAPGNEGSKITIPVRGTTPGNAEILVSRRDGGLCIKLTFYGKDGSRHDIGFRLIKDSCSDSAKLSLGFAKPSV